jgi:uncharacterized membrane protein YbhN (UPF0104 family)
VDGGPQLGLRQASKIVAAGFGAFFAASASGGFKVDYLALRNAGARRKEALARVLGLGMLEYAVLAPVTCAAACVLLVHHSRISTGFTMPWAIGVPAGALIAIGLMPHRKRFNNARGWRGLLAVFLDALSILKGLAGRPRRGVFAAIGMTMYWAGDAFCLWACLYGFLGKPLPVLPFIVGYATGYALSRRTLPLAGAGVVEALLPFALLWVSLPLAAGMLAVLAYRFFNLWLPLVPAVVGFRRLRAVGA